MNPLQDYKDRRKSEIRQLDTDAMYEIPKGITVKQFLTGSFVFLVVCGMIYAFYLSIMYPPPYTQWYKTSRTAYMTAAENHEVKLHLLRSFNATGTVLSIDRSTDSWAEIAPYDVAIAWGEYLDPKTHAKLEPRQADRNLYWVTPAQEKTMEIIKSTANLHMIPANALVLEQIKNLKTGDLVHISGALVDIKLRNEEWKTSKSNVDIGYGSGEIIFVVSIRVAK